MIRRHYPAGVSYLFAIVITGIALGISLIIRPVTEANPFLLFWVAVGISGWFGGMPAGLLTAALSAFVTNWFFFPTVNGFDTDFISITRMVGFMVGASIISGLFELQRRTEYALDKNRQQTIEILENLDDAFCSLDEDWRFVYVNPRLERFWNRNRHELIGKNVWETLPFLKNTDIESELKRVAEQRVTVRFEVMSPSTGQWLEATAYPTRNGISAYFHSIHDRKLSEQRTALLQRITERLSSALTLQQVGEVILSEVRPQINSSVMAIYLLSGDHLEIMMQQGMAEENLHLYQFVPLTINVPIVDVIKSAQPLWIETLEGYIALYPHIERPLRLNGTHAAACLPMIVDHRIIGTISISFSTAHTFDESERALIRAVVQQCAQALERARLYEAERRSETRMRLITNALPVLISYLDTEGCYRFVNEAYQAWFGMAPETIPGKKIREVLGDKAYTTVEPYVRTVLSGEPVNYEAEVTYRTGGTRHVDATYVPDFDENGSVRGYFSLVIDITRRKLTEKRLQALQRITAAFSGAMTPHEVAGVIIHQGMNLINAHAATLSMLDETTGELVTVSEHEIRFKWGRIPMTTRSGLTDCIRTGQPVWIENETDYRELYPELTDYILNQGIAAGAALPFSINGKITGCLGIGFNSPQRFTEEDRALMQALAQQCGQALERARLYDETREQREHFQVTLQSIGDAVIATDTGGRITFINPVARQLTGWTESEAVNQPLDEVFCIVNESTRKPVENPYDKVMREGAIVGLANHTLLISRDGREIPIDDSGAPIRGGDGQIIGVILVFRDITDRKLSEQLIETTLYKTLDLYEISRRLNAATSAEDVLKAFAASRSLHGLYHAAALRFDRVWQETPPDIYQIVAGLRSDVSFSGVMGKDNILSDHPIYDLFRRDAPVLVHDVRAEGRYLHLDTNVQSVISYPLITGGQWFGQLNLYSRRPTQWTETELEHIQALVDQAATVLQSIHLFEMEKQARQMAEQANRLKLRFLGMISHELRTPLTSIKGFASSLLAQDVQWDDESRNQFLTIIDSEADKLKNLIEQLLDLTSLEAGTLRIRPERQTLQKMIDSAMPQLQVVAIRHELLIELPLDLPDVNADSQRIGQVLVNLVHNAAKFAPFKSPIKVNAQIQKNGYIQIDVSDRGPGIPPEARTYIFEAFRQVDDAKRFKSGAGLGLAICKGLVEGHGGHIWVEDAPEGGALISFTLPLAH